MAAFAASLVADEARVLLNNVGASTYTNTVLFPVVVKAYEELQQNFILKEVPIMKEISAAIAVGIGALTVTLPTDLVEPLFLEERYPGEVNYIPMEEKPWEPNVTQDSRLRYWSWREEEIKLVGATSACEVRIRPYIKRLPDLASIASNILITNSKNYLAARVAAITAGTIAHNESWASILQGDAENLLGILIRYHLKKNQSLPVRRMAFRRPGRRWGMR